MDTNDSTSHFYSEHVTSRLFQNSYPNTREWYAFRLWKIYITKGVLLFLAWKQWHAVLREPPVDLHPLRGGGDRPRLKMIRSFLANMADWDS